MSNSLDRKGSLFLAAILIATSTALVIRAGSNGATNKAHPGASAGRGVNVSYTSGSSSSLVPSKEIIGKHIEKTLVYIYRNINPDTCLGYSFPGDRRLKYWSVTYDDAMRVIAHIQTGDINMARQTIDYFMENTAIQKRGWFTRDQKLQFRDGWVVNIVDAGEKRPGGRGIEHIAHVGPNAYLGIAALHLYRATGIKGYLTYAKSRWSLIKDLQNENPDDVNYGGVRMGPLGNPADAREQKLEFKSENPSFYCFYNGEHAADFKALSDLLAKVDSDNRDQYLNASRLITIWDHKIYDKQKHLFFIGTTEKRFYESNIAQWINPGIIPMIPLDTNALKISAYGVQGLEEFENNGAELIRQAIEDNFKVTVNTLIDDRPKQVTGYDFVTHADRKRLVFFEEEGPDGDIKVNKGTGRQPMVTDEWSNWVALADLRLAKDFKKFGENNKSAFFLLSYKENAFIQGMKSGDALGDNALAYPYAQPIPAGFNKPVGFGWNTQHEPYCLIAGTARILGLLGADPFSLDSNLINVPVKLPNKRLATRVIEDPNIGLMTEAESYVNRAWAAVRSAQKRHNDEADRWKDAARIIERMFAEHPDWCTMAAAQNKLAIQSGDKFPFFGEPVKRTKELEPIYRKYWALYHVGTGEFIRAMSYKELAYFAKSRNDKEAERDSMKKAHKAAENIIHKYYYAQTYDKTGWLWQPVRSLKEYFEEYDSIL